jgi:hypothetical protein
MEDAVIGIGESDSSSVVEFAVFLPIASGVAAIGTFAGDFEFVDAAREFG